MMKPVTISGEDAKNILKTSDGEIVVFRRGPIELVVDLAADSDNWFKMGGLAPQTDQPTIIDNPEVQ